jgi:adenosylhomocysteine nucleosidase
MLGVMTAMPEEAEALIHEAQGSTERIEHGRRVFHIGTLWGREAAIVVSRCGKVAAATTATELIVRYSVEKLLFTGVAGALDHALSPGDIVIADTLVQHDIDASPMWPPRTVPLIDRETFDTDPDLTHDLTAAAERYTQAHRPAARVHRGAIVSGDQFIKSKAQVETIRAAVPNALCVEMEGAAAAQVAYEYGVPLAVARVISDHADEHAPGVFLKNLAALAADSSLGIVRSLLAPAPFADPHPNTPGARR